METSLVDARVTRSCGCVFCDLNIRVGMLHGKRVHYVSQNNEYVPCTKELVPAAGIEPT